MLKPIYFIILVIQYFSIITCKSQISTASEPLDIPLISYKEAGTYDSIFNWRSDDYAVTKDGEIDLMSLNQVKKRFYLKKGQLYSYKKGLINKTKINYYINKSVRLSIVIDEGQPFSNYYYRIADIPSQCSQDDRKQSLKSHLNIFKEGKGKWQDFYFRIYKNNYIENPLKEKGEVKNHFKYGEWTYYNADSSINSKKKYSINDSVDVRFPHCLFNENEACFTGKQKIVVLEPYDKKLEEEDLIIPFSFVQEAPKFPGCSNNKKETLNRKCFQNKVKTFFKNEVKKSNIKIDKRTRVLISFTVLKDGKTGAINVYTSNKQLKENILKTIIKLPIMEAGKEKGSYINVTYALPIYFEQKE